MTRVRYAWKMGAGLGHAAARYRAFDQEHVAGTIVHRIGALAATAR
jgi:hypothetical protein